jgi:predicted dithiol-disulfide oxidoreductase (DUF899 family)
MNRPDIVSREEWLKARIDLLEKEKELTVARDALSAERRKIPWVLVEKEYSFEGSAGTESLADLFGSNSQLLVYHFMFDPEWEDGCKSCSFWADNYNGTAIHLAHRDVSMVTIGRAPFEKLDAYRQRMGWDFKIISSLYSDFNYDYHVSFTPEQMETGEISYNFRMGPAFSAEAPGISVFHKDMDGNIYHTYSTYARGLDMLNGAYHLLDLVPAGRDEQDLSYGMEWLCRHDQYQN